jgi:hypothetical protein
VDIGDYNGGTLDIGSLYFIRRKTNLNLPCFFNSRMNEETSALENGMLSLENIEYDRLTYEKCLAAVRYRGSALYSVPEHMRSYVICLEAVRNDGMALMYVPDNIISKEHCITAVRQNPDAVDLVPDNFMDQEIVDAV